MTKPRQQHLSVVPQAEKPRAPRSALAERLNAIPRPACLLQCPRCAGQELIEARSGVLLQGGKTRGGTKAMLCVACLLRGERVVV